MLYPIRGRVPPPDSRPAGCTFGPRCDYVQERCRREKPMLRQMPTSASAGAGSWARCHFAEEIIASDWKPSDDLLLPVIAVDHGPEETILEVKNLKKYYEVKGGSLRDVVGTGEKRYVKAVENVSFKVKKGRTLGIVGESGCGKSTLARAVMALERPTQGTVRLKGSSLFDLPPAQLQALRRHFQMVFQDPYGSLHPRHTVDGILSEPARVHGLDNIKDRVVRALDEVGLNASFRFRYPHQISGGQRQRVAVARALIIEPEIVLLDEPTSALDVSVQAQILNLLKDLQDELGLTMLFISHDLPVIRQMCDRVAIMRHGRILETADSETFFENPQNEYSIELLSLMPRFDSIYETEAAAQP